MALQQLHILLVDDDDFFSDVIARQLEEELHHKVTIASNGREAEKLLISGKHHFDIILTDYEMPDVNGLELLRWIQEHKIETPVVMLTAAGSESIAVEAMKLGAYDYIRKEHLDLHHLGVVIHGTHERHELRIARALEEERMREIALNALATDKVRDVLNALTPSINDAFANIHSELEVQGDKILKEIPERYRKELQELLKRIQKETVALETAIRGLLGLYRILYAHHAEVSEIERLKREIESKE
ncbi:MAG: response regulator [Bacteroidetes bacterium]|nr:response regulator [Bacteroidota bacterium]